MAERDRVELALPPARLPAALNYALQPIAGAHTGTVYAYEALLRGTAEAGFPAIDAFFDDAYAAGRLAGTELALLQLAMTTYRRLPHKDEKKLFLNLDGRVFEDPAFSVADIGILADRTGISRSSVILELSEKQNIAAGAAMATIIADVRRQGLRLAVDDFGQGFSELRLLYEASPEYVKIDRFFVKELERSPRKRLFVSMVANLVHTLGARVVAEGVETAAEYKACLEAGCDLIQGFFLARPIFDVAHAPEVYAPLREPRLPGPAAPALPDLEAIAPVHPGVPMVRLLQHFALRPERAWIPVVDAAGEPLGIVCERQIRRLVEERGTDGRMPESAVVRVPIVEHDADLDAIVDTVASHGEADAVIITHDRRYHGAVSVQGLLRIVSRRRQLAALDCNPVSQLPGASAFHSHIDACLDTAQRRLFCLFNFNHFKAFNDAYGFQLGDRVIRLFAEVLKKSFASNSYFVAHLGGDSFFAGSIGGDVHAFEMAVRAAVSSFRRQVESLYTPEDRARGYVQTVNRDGNEAMFPLMTCSAGVLVLPPGRPMPPQTQFEAWAQSVLRDAKISRDGIFSQIVG